MRPAATSKSDEPVAPTLGAGAGDFLDALSRNPPEPDPVKARLAAAFLRRPWNEGGPVMAETRDVVLDLGDEATMRARLYRPAEHTEHAPTIAYLHGGGWVLLGIDTHDRLMRELAEAGGCDVVGLAYPLAPETRFPGAIDACTAAVRALPRALPGLGPLVLGGDSAGANIAVAVALVLRNAREDDTLAGLLLAYGVYDCDLSRASYASFGEPPYQLTADKMEGFWEHYCPRDRENPLASPLRADLHGLPPIHMIVAEQDALADENEAFADALRAAGIALSIDRHADMPHGFLEALSFIPAGGEAVARAGEWLRAMGDMRLESAS